MTEEKEVKKVDEKPKEFIIKLVEVASRDKEGKEVKDERGNLIYRQADAFSFNQILGVIDTANYDLKDLRMLGKIQDKFEEAWKDEKKEIKLTFDMVAFLKDFYVDHRKKLRKDATLSPFLIRTLVAIADQVETL